jgi:hypothetical protein
MTASILMYGIFTALAGTATSVCEWNGYRFLTAIGVGGGYPKLVRSNARSQDPDIQCRLWTIAEELTGVAYPV